jgi:hypothetical protein
MYLIPQPAVEWKVNPDAPATLAMTIHGDGLKLPATYAQPQALQLGHLVNTLQGSFDLRSG